VRKLLVLFALGALAAGLLATGGSAATTAGACGVQAPGDGAGRFGGIISAQAIAGSCSVSNYGNAARGAPPLIYWGGPVMSSTANNPVVVTPIFWNPGNYPMTNDYKNLIKRYLADVAAASGSNTNVFSVANEYFGSNGPVAYNFSMGTPINDTHSYPRGDCQVASNDTSGIYADGTGYSICLDDAQITNEIARVTAAGGLPTNDYTHEYVVFTSKHVESCFNAGSTLTNANACTINHQPSAAYCAYHSMAGPNWPSFGTIYANMPFPIYASGTHYTCGSDAGNFLGGLQSPNHNLDADTEISPLSHEINESITDPNVYNGWYDQAGYENGDECAYVWGSVSGPFGAEYNQSINGHVYLTQEEFSNIDFFASGGGCVQGQAYEA